MSKKLQLSMESGSGKKAKLKTPSIISHDVIIKDNPTSTKYKTPTRNEDDSISHDLSIKDISKVKPMSSDSPEEGDFVLKLAIVRNFLTQIQSEDVPDLNELLIDAHLYRTFERQLSDIWYKTTDVTHPEVGLTDDEEKRKKERFLRTVMNHHILIKTEIGKHEMMSQFEKKIELILDSVPSKVKDDFMTLCFIRWEGDVYPALQVNPFEIRPGEVTNQWMSFYYKMTGSQSKRKKPWYRLVYWYGSKEGSLESYSLLPQNKIISYENGCDKGYDQISPQLEEKLNLEKNTTEYEDLKIRGLQLMRSDAKKEKKDRKSHWIFNFFEEDVLSHWGDVLRTEKSTVSNYSSGKSK